MAFEPRSQVEWEHQDSPSGTLAAASATTFMNRVYAWMVAGLAVTGGVAYAIGTSPQLFMAVAPYFWPLVLGELALVFVLSAMAPRLPFAAAAALFTLYAALNGVTLSGIFFIYKLGSVANVFFISAAMFFALSAYGTLTRRSLSAWGSFLFMGLVGVLVAGVVNIFLQSDMLRFVMSCAGVVVFAGLTAYDTQKLREMHASSGYSSAGSLAVNGALVLYLDFINLFLSLLRLFGSRR